MTPRAKDIAVIKDSTSDDTTTPVRRPSPLDRAFLTGVDGTGTLILVRHGQQEWPDPDNSTASDWVDPPLSTTGQKQAACVGEHLAGEPVAAVYSSQLLRANDTGLAIAAHHDLPVEVMKDLEEIHIFRDLPQDKRAADTIGAKAIQGVGERFVQTGRWDAYPATESSADFRNRVARSVEAAISSHPGETVVVACHGGVINAYLAELLGTSADMFFRPVHASVHRISFGPDRRVIEVLNEQHYLAAANLVTT